MNGGLEEEAEQVRASCRAHSGVVGLHTIISVVPGYLLRFRPSGQLRSSRNLVKHTLWAVQTRIGSGR
ncbi:hypothetical protein D3C78_954750 [compost metagenome]